MGMPKTRGLCEIVLAALEDILLLPCGLSGLTPVDEAEEEDGSSIVWLEHQRLLEIFFGALQRCGLPQERKHPCVGTARADAPAPRQAAPAPAWQAQRARSDTLL